MVRGKPRRTKKNLINKTPDWLRAREGLRSPAEEYPAVLLLIGFDRRCFYSVDLGADTEAGQRCAASMLLFGSINESGSLCHSVATSAAGSEAMKSSRKRGM